MLDHSVLLKREKHRHTTLKIFALIYFLLLASTVQSQVLHYEVVKGSKPLGEMSSHHYRSGDQEFYHIRSDVSFKILFSFNVAYEQKEVFKNDTLIEGTGYNTLNESIQKKTAINKRQNDYQLSFDGVNNRLNEVAIIQSMSQIHFREPTDGASFFSQHFGQSVTFEKIGQHRYAMTSPDGENEYTYENGYCTEIKVVRDYATFYFKMKPETLVRVKNKTDSLFHR